MQGDAEVQPTESQEFTVDVRPLTDGPPRLATYFAVYPERLGLQSDNTQTIFLTGQMLHGYADLPCIGTHYQGDEIQATLPPDSPPLVFVSLRFHRGSRPTDRIMETVADLHRVVDRVAPALGFHQVEPVPSEADDPYAAYSVVEMVTPLVMPTEKGWIPAQPTSGPMGPTLTRCIDALRDVVTGYRLAEELPIPIPARERLGPLIIGATRPADPDAGGWDPDASQVINGYAMPREAISPRWVGPEISQQIAMYFGAKALSHPSLAVKELQLDADVARNQTGDFRSAVLLAYCASEVFLDAVLAGLCWEEGLSPASALTLFRNSLLTRVRNHYQHRLGGGWSTRGTGPAAVWRSNLVLLRHRVAHAGASPSREETDAAFQAHEALRTHVLDRIVSSRRKYPQTTGLLVGKSGLDRRGLWNSRTAELIADAQGRLPSFIDWRDELLKLRSSPASP